MNDPTRTTEGMPYRCPVCGKRMSVTPEGPHGEIVCPHCGTLFYPEVGPAFLLPDDLKRLADLGVIVDTDDEGEVTRVEFNGFDYTDESIPGIAELKGVPVIDIRNTRITKQGAEQLRKLLPESIIEF